VYLRFRWLVLCVTFLCGTAFADLLDRPWSEYRSRHFVVLSDKPEAEVAKAVDDLELFRSVVLRVTNAREGMDKVPVDLYLFASTGDFQTAISQPNTLGFMRPGLRTQYMASAGGVIGLDAQHVVFHEYVHYLLRNGGATALHPKWYDEGLAEMLAATRLREDKVVLGGDIPERIRDLTSGITVPLGEVIRTNDLSDWHPYQTAVFYSKSFALVNYLHLSRLATKTDRLPQMREYLRLCGEGMESEAAFEQAFAMKVSLMERELHKFLTRSMRPVLQLPMQAFEHDGTYTRRAVSAAEIAYRLGYLIVLASPATARALFQHDDLHAVDARHRAAVGVSYQAEQDYERARGEMTVALGLAPDDPIVLQEIADLLTFWCRSDEAPSDCGPFREEARQHYKHLLAVEPDRLEAHAAFGMLLNDIGDPTGAVMHLTPVYEAAPWFLPSIAELGIARQQSGDPAAAVPLLRRALAWIEGDSPYAGRVRQALADAERAAR
jgi:tetratricopeptide (TPR) repeat protein